MTSRKTPTTPDNGRKTPRTPVAAQAQRDRIAREAGESIAEQERLAEHLAYVDDLERRDP